MEYYAHTRMTPSGRIEQQTVWEHLEKSASYAAQSLKTVGLEKCAYLSALLHDIGKFTTEFQQYLADGDRSRQGRVIHSFQGCRYLLERYHKTEDSDLSKITAELLAYTVGAHHGLFDCVDPKRQIGLLHRLSAQGISYEESVDGFFSGQITQKEIDLFFSEAEKELDRVVRRLEDSYAADDDYSFAVGLLARLLLSAVIEGDRRDTVEFMTGQPAQFSVDDMAGIWASRLHYMEEKLRQFPTADSIAAARQSISESCREFAEQPPGIYRLNVPTGAGKTLSSLRYALAHAKKFNKRRIIFTSPLLSILEQNASVIHAFVGDDKLVLEHHSNVVQTQARGDELDQKELMTQNWNAPIILTTMVQLLNTLFDGKTTAIRRFWALCDSVIIIDEVQSVPTKLLTLFNLALQFLAEQCGATVILCSATQPYFEGAEHPLRQAPCDIVVLAEGMRAAFRRTKPVLLEGVPLEKLPPVIHEKLKQNNSLLVICNKKEEAAFLMEKARTHAYQSFHLSAAMCMQHRRDVIATLQDSLKAGEKVLCVSTQVVEAGVDISFGAVLRLAAGLDSIVQAAGRCNRHGESQTPKPVYIVNCTDERLGKLPDIKRGKDAALALFEAYRIAPERFGGDLFSQEAIRYYYQKVYQSMSLHEQDDWLANEGTTMFDLMSLNEKFADEDCSGIQNYYLRQALRTAGRNFSVFEENTADVLVPYGAGKELAAQLCSRRAETDSAYRDALLKQMSSYTVSLYEHQRKQLEKEHALTPIFEGSVLMLAEEYYDAVVGLTVKTNEPEFLEV